MNGYEEFKKNIDSLTGIDLSLYKERQMRRRIESLMNKNRFKNFESYFLELEKHKKKIEKDNSNLYEEFLKHITINVSEFYRNPNQWVVLEKIILPEMIKRKNGKPLKVWSSACSSGEEPYSLVMLLSKFFDLNKIEVLATDLDKAIIAKAKQGLYAINSLKCLPKSFIQMYFREVNGLYKIDDKIKSRVSFKQMDLLKDPFPKGYDLILCRNVIIYFTEESKDILYKKFNNSLVNDGILFVGCTEQIMNPHIYNLKSDQTFFYKKYS